MLTYAATSGKTLCSGSADNLLRVWRLKDRVCTHTLKGHKNWILTLACSPMEERQV
jgi:WD40 repeat protein